MEINFAYRPFLLLLAIIPLLVAWYIWKYRQHGADIRFSNSEFLKGVRKSFRLRLLHLPFALRMLALALLIVALARPQSSARLEDISVEGIDIMIALDISGSMLAEDFRPNRMEVAKKTALEFIAMRPTDRIGMAVFSGQSFTLVPLTTDHTLLNELTAGVTIGMIEDGTAIGDGLATAINRLRESQAISRVIILLTDGINNAGVIDPLTAAEIAAIQGIRLHTIGVGTKGSVPFPFQTPFGVQYRQVEIPVDEALLNQMATMTGGRYFWADNPTKLLDIYEEIDQLERTRHDVTEYTRKNDEYLPLVLLALLLLAIEMVLKNTWLRTNP